MATMAASSTATSPYPIALEVQDAAPQNRLFVLLRLILAIPHLIILYVLSLAIAIVWVISWVAILVTGTYPAGLLRFSIGAWRWTIRAYAYAVLLTGKYPPFSLDDDEGYPVRLLVSEEIEGRNRLTTFWPIRLILAIPHAIILTILLYAAAVVVVIAWIVALVTGSVPSGLHKFLAGYLRWSARASGYIYNLVDEYPPFSLI